MYVDAPENIINNNIQKWIKKNNFFILNKLMVFLLTTKTLDIIWINKKVICL